MSMPWRDKKPPGGRVDPPLHLAWHREHLHGIVALTSAYYFLLVPAETSGNLALIEFDLITQTGRPAGRQDLREPAPTHLATGPRPWGHRSAADLLSQGDRPRPQAL